MRYTCITRWCWLSVVVVSITASAVHLRAQPLIMLIAGDKIATENFVGGIWAGVAFSTFRGMNDATYQRNWSIGTYLHWKLSDHWGFVPEIGFKMPGGANGLTGLWQEQPQFDSLITERQEWTSLSYFSLPILVRYNTGPIAVFAGPQLGYALVANDAVSGTVSTGAEVEITKDAFTHIKKWDYGVAVGIEWVIIPSFGIHSFRAGARFYQGFADITAGDNATVTNSSFMLTFGVPIGGGPKEQKEPTSE